MNENQTKQIHKLCDLWYFLSSKLLGMIRVAQSMSETHKQMTNWAQHPDIHSITQAASPTQCEHHTLSSVILTQIRSSKPAQQQTILLLQG